MIVLDYDVHVLYRDLGLLGLLDLVHDFGHYLREFVLTFYYAVKNIYWVCKKRSFTWNWL